MQIINYIKFSLIGLLRFIITFTLYIIFIEILHPVVAISIIWPFSIMTSIILHKRFLFKSNIGLTKLSRNYFLIYLFTYLLNAIILFLLVDIFLYDPIISQFFTLIFLSIISFNLINRAYSIKN